MFLSKGTDFFYYVKNKLIFCDSDYWIISYAGLKESKHHLSVYMDVEMIVAWSNNKFMWKKVIPSFTQKTTIFPLSKSSHFFPKQHVHS